MKVFNKKISILLAFAMVLGCMGLIGCGGKTRASIGDSTITICKFSDYESIKNKWYNGLVEDFHTNELEAGETYYLVWTMKSLKAGSHCNLDFYLKAWGGLFRKSDAVDFDNDNIVVDGNLRVKHGETGNIIGCYTLEDQSAACIVIPFVPKQGGVMCVDCAVINYTEKVEKNRLEERIYATVMNNTDALNDGAKVTISNLSYGVVSQEIYESRQLDKITDVTSVSQLTNGLNYFVLDFDITSQNEYDGEVYCSIYLHTLCFSGNPNLIINDWSSKIEQANTAKTAEYEVDGGKIFDFSYTTPHESTKKIRTVLSLELINAHSVGFEIFVYGDQTLVKGETYTFDSFIDYEYSTLEYRMDENAQAYYVSGYETMTGYVSIPEYHNGYPVVGVDKKAFAKCEELEFLQLGKIETIGDSAFENCSNLSTIYGSKALEVIGAKAFSGCYSLEIGGYDAQLISKNLRIIGKNAFRGVDVHSLGHDYWKTDRGFVNVSEKSVSDFFKNRNDEMEAATLMRMGGARIYVISESAYQMGDYEDAIDTEKIFYEAGKSMEVNQTYYWVVDFTNTIYKGASNHTWEVYFDSTLEIEYSLKEAVGDGWWWYDNGDGVITLHYDNSTDGKTQTLRLIFEVTPVQKGKGTATLCFDGDITFAAWNEYLGDYGDYDYDNESISPASRKITVR